jgi:hypothetical protein
VLKLYVNTIIRLWIQKPFPTPCEIIVTRANLFCEVFHPPRRRLIYQPENLSVPPSTYSICLTAKRVIERKNKRVGGGGGEMSMQYQAGIWGAIRNSTDVFCGDCPWKFTMGLHDFLTASNEIYNILLNYERGILPIRPSFVRKANGLPHSKLNYKTQFSRYSD